MVLDQFVESQGEGSERIGISSESADYPFLALNMFNQEDGNFNVTRFEAILRSVYQKYYQDSGNTEDIMMIFSCIENASFGRKTWVNGCLGNVGLENIDFTDFKERKILLGYAQAELRLRRLGNCLAFVPISFGHGSRDKRLMKAINAAMKEQAVRIIAPFFEEVSVMHSIDRIVGGKSSIIDLGSELHDMRKHLPRFIWSDDQSLAAKMVEEFIDPPYRSSAVIGKFCNLPIYARLKYIGSDRGRAAEKEWRKKTVSYSPENKIVIENDLGRVFCVEYFFRTYLDMSPVSLDKMKVSDVNGINLYNEQRMMLRAALDLSFGLKQIEHSKFLRNHPENMDLGYPSH